MQNFVYAMIDAKSTTGLTVTGFNPYDFSCGTGLLDHSFIRSENITILYALLADKSFTKEIKSCLPFASFAGKWANKSIYHAGESCNKFIFKGEEIKNVFDHVRFKNRFFNTISRALKSESDNSKNTLFKSKNLDSLYEHIFNGRPLYVVNTSKGEYLDISAHMFTNATIENKNKTAITGGDISFCLDPLSFLMASKDDNVHSNNSTDYGAWLGDSIFVSRNKPADGMDITSDFFFYHNTRCPREDFTASMRFYRRNQPLNMAEFKDLAVLMSDDENFHQWREHSIVPVLNKTVVIINVDHSLSEDFI